MAPAATSCQRRALFYRTARAAAPATMECAPVETVTTAVAARRVTATRTSHRAMLPECRPVGVSSANPVRVSAEAVAVAGTAALATVTVITSIHCLPGRLIVVQGQLRVTAGVASP